MCSESNVLFIRCRREIRLRNGYQLRTTTMAVNAMTSAAYQCGCVAGGPAGGEIPKTAASVEVSSTLSASTIVSQFSQEKLPDRTSQIWVIAMINAQTPAIGGGPNNPNGTTS